MQDVITKRLQAASWRGFSFLCPDEQNPKQGRKIAIHNYPNTNKRFAQDLGEYPEDFNVTAIITGDNYLNRTRNFKALLNQKGLGRLVLPHQGALDVVALPYDVDYSQKSAGVVTFKLKFTISNTSEVPAQAPSSVEDVFQAADDVRFRGQVIWATEQEVPSSKTNFLTAANDMRRSVVDTVQDFTHGMVQQDAQLQKIVRDIETDLAILIRDPILMAEKMVYGTQALANGFMSTLSILFSQVKDVFTGDDDENEVNSANANDMIAGGQFGKNFTDPGASPSESGIVLWPDDTGERQQRNKNRVLTVENVRVNFLTFAFEVAANFKYKTSAEISGVQTALEEEFTNQMLNDDPNSIFNQDQEFKLLMDTLKTFTYEVLEQKSQQVYSVGTFIVRTPQSSMNLAFKLYAEEITDPDDLQGFAEDLVELNPDQNPTQMLGEIKIFEVG